MLQNNRFVQRLKVQAEENPLLAVFIGATALSVVAKVIQANTERSNARTWAKEVERRDRKSRY
jgi:hypothetical protein